LARPARCASWWRRSRSTRGEAGGARARDDGHRSVLGRGLRVRAKRADRVKLVYFDGTGVCLFAKRLEDGKFCWPGVTDGVVRLTAAQLQALLEGLDRRRVHETRETRVPIAAS
jgi:transposase